MSRKLFACSIILGLYALRSFAQEVTSPSGLHAAQLRVINSGNEAIENLTVFFPGSEVQFGDVPPGSTTAYKEAPRGVYRYGAYRFELRGQVIVQPVTDWVGEAPMEGTRFTYRLEFDSNRTRPMLVRLAGVTTDR